MIQAELTAAIFEAHRTAIKAKGGTRLVAVFTLSDGKVMSLPAIDGKFDDVFKITDSGLEVWTHGKEEGDTPESEATKVTYVTPHSLSIVPFSLIRSYEIKYSTLRKVNVVPEAEPTA